MHGALERGTARRLEAHRRFRAPAIPAKIALQLGHAGRKGSTQLGWQAMDHPLPGNNWPLVSASPIPYLAGASQTPREMNEADRLRVRGEFVHAARLGSEAGFDMLEAAHGPRLSAGEFPVAAHQHAAR